MQESIFNAVNVAVFSTLICADLCTALSLICLYTHFSVSVSLSLGLYLIVPYIFFVFQPPVLHLCLNSVSILSCFSLCQCVFLQSFFVHVSVSSSPLSLLYSSFISFPLFLFFPIPLAKVDNNLWIQVELHFWNRTLVLEPIKLDSEKWEKS